MRGPYGKCIRVCTRARDAYAKCIRRCEAHVYGKCTSVLRTYSHEMPYVARTTDGGTIGRVACKSDQIKSHHITSTQIKSNQIKTNFIKSYHIAAHHVKYNSKEITSHHIPATQVNQLNSFKTFQSNQTKESNHISKSPYTHSVRSAADTLSTQNGGRFVVTGRALRSTMCPQRMHTGSAHPAPRPFRNAYPNSHTGMRTQLAHTWNAHHRCIQEMHNPVPRRRRW